MAGFGQLNHDVEINNSAGGGGVTILPDDDYELEITESDVKASSTGKGQNFDNKVQVVSGPHKGVWFFSGVTSIQHESAQAQAIGQGQLKALSTAAGVDFHSLTDTEQLHYRPFWARVGSETYYSKKHGKEMTKNVIKKYLWDGMPEDAEPAPAGKAEPTPPPKQPEQAKPAATGSRPWSKK